MKVRDHETSPLDVINVKRPSEVIKCPQEKRGSTYPLRSQQWILLQPSSAEHQETETEAQSIGIHLKDDKGTGASWSESRPCPLAYWRETWCWCLTSSNMSILSPAPCPFYAILLTVFISFLPLLLNPLLNVTNSVYSLYKNFKGYEAPTQAFPQLPNLHIAWKRMSTHLPWRPTSGTSTEMKSTLSTQYAALPSGARSS